MGRYFEDDPSDWGVGEYRELDPDNVLKPDDEQLHEWWNEHSLALDRVIDEKAEAWAEMKGVAEAIEDIQRKAGMNEQLDEELLDKLNQEHREAEPLARHELLDQDPRSELPEDNFDKEREEWERLNQMNQRQPDPWNTFGNK